MAPTRGDGGSQDPAEMPEDGESRDGAQARAAEQRFDLVVSSVRDYAIFMLDPAGRVATWNAGAHLIKGYLPDEVIGKSISIFYTPEDVARGRPRALLDRALAEGRVEDEGWRVRKDGRLFWADVVITPMRDASNALVGFAKITRDLTERRKAEEERVRLARAQEAIRVRNEFISIASHELKTPLTALQLQMLGIRDHLAPDESTTKKIDRATRMVNRLGGLVEALLDASRIAGGGLKLNLESFDLNEAAREVTDRLHDPAKGARCDLSLDVDGSLVGRWDRLRIEQVLVNLVSNSIKYAAGEPIEISIRRENDTAILRVRDKGPGIPEGDLPRIFERFERAASTRHYGGMGLGLYVARQTAEAHGGTIIASNLAGGGACLTVRLPLEAPTASPA